MLSIEKNLQLDKQQQQQHKLKKYLLFETTTIDKTQHDENIKDKIFFNIKYCKYSKLFATLLSEFKSNILVIEESIVTKFNNDTFSREFIATKRVKNYEKKKITTTINNNDKFIIFKNDQNDKNNQNNNDNINDNSNDDNTIVIKTDMTIPINISTVIMEKFMMYFEYLHKKNKQQERFDSSDDDDDSQDDEDDNNYKKDENYYNYLTFSQNSMDYKYFINCDDDEQEENMENNIYNNESSSNDNDDIDYQNDIINNDSDEELNKILKYTDKFEKNLMNVDLYFAFDMLKAADYIECKQLIFLCCKHINNIIKNDTSVELEEKLSFLNNNDNLKFEPKFYYKNFN